MKRKVVSINWDAETLRQLDAYVKERATLDGAVGRSAVVNVAVREYLKRRKK